MTEGKDKSNSDDSTSTNASSTTEKVKRKLPWYWYLIFVLTIVSVGMWGWKENSLRSQQTRIEEQTREILAQHTDEFLSVTGQTLAWAVRAEMIRENYDRINEYASEIVRQPGMQSFGLVQNDGVIWISSDKKNEGRSAEEVYAEFAPNPQEALRETGSNGNVFVVNPIYGLSEKLGVMILEYRPSDVSID